MNLNIRRWIIYSSLVKKAFELVIYCHHSEPLPKTLNTSIGGNLLLIFSTKPVRCTSIKKMHHTSKFGEDRTSKNLRHGHYRAPAQKSLTCSINFNLHHVIIMAQGLASTSVKSVLKKYFYKSTIRTNPTRTSYNLALESAPKSW